MIYVQRGPPPPRGRENDIRDVHAHNPGRLNERGKTGKTDRKEDTDENAMRLKTRSGAENNACFILLKIKTKMFLIFGFFEKKKINKQTIRARRHHGRVESIRSKRREADA